MIQLETDTMENAANDKKARLRLLTRGEGKTTGGFASSGNHDIIVSEDSYCAERR